MNRQRTAIWLALILPALFLTVIFRLIPAWGTVMTDDGELRLLGVDTFYHLRHVERVAETFPRLDRVENVSHFPKEDRSDAIGLFQWVMGGIAKLCGGTPQAARWVCAWAGPLSAFLIGGMVALVSRRLWGWQVSVVVTWLLVFFPGRAFDRTVFGFCDHHGLEVVFNLALCWMVAVLAGAGERGPKWPRSWWWLGSIPVAYLMTWRGAPLFIAALLVGAGLGILWILLSGRSPARLLRGLGQTLLGSWLLALVLGLIWPVLKIDPAFFDMALWMLAGGAVVCVIGGVVMERVYGKLHPAALTLLILVLGWAGWLVALKVVPGLEGNLWAALGRKSAGIQEHQAFTWPVIWSNFGPTAFLAVLGLAWTLFRSRQSALPVLAVVPMGWVVLAVWARSGDYDYDVAPFMVLLTGAFWSPAMQGLQQLSETRLKERFRLPVRVGLPVMAVLALASAVYPIGQVAGPVRPAAFFSNFAFFTDPWKRAMVWLRQEEAPEGKGVWSHWPWGNLISAEGKWPALQSRYPSGEHLAPMFTPGEDRAIGLPINGTTFSQATRYVLVNDTLASKDLLAEIAHMGLQGNQIVEGVPNPSAPGEMLPRLNRYYTGTLLGRMFTLNGTGLQRFRAVFESPELSYLRYLRYPDGRMTLMTSAAPTDPAARAVIEQRMKSSPPPWPESGAMAYGALLMPTVKIFEQVPGARIEYVDPNVLSAKVTLELQAQPGGRRFAYEQTAERVGEDSLQFVLPYAHDAGPRVQVRPVSPYRLTATLIGNKSVQSEFTLPEEAVAGGRSIRMDGVMKEE